MKTLLSLALFAFVTPAIAGTVHQFNCLTDTEIETRGHHGSSQFVFKVNNLEQGKLTYVEAEDVNGIEGPVIMNPKNSVLMLNDNHGIKRARGSKDIVMESDGDGIQFTTVRLYANSNYSSGYAQVKFSSEEHGIYTKVFCQVFKLK